MANVVPSKAASDPAATDSALAQGTNVNPTPLPDPFEPRDQDVCCGRGKRNWNHTGNIQFRNLIQSNVDAYISAPTKTDKTSVVMGIVDQVRKGGSLFVKQDEDTGRWYDIGDSLAREKVGHSLRDQVTAMKKHREKDGTASSAASTTSGSVSSADTIKGKKKISKAAQSLQMKQQQATTIIPAAEPLTAASFLSDNSIAASTLFGGDTLSSENDPVQMGTARQQQLSISQQLAALQQQQNAILQQQQQINALSSGSLPQDTSVYGGNMSQMQQLQQQLTQQNQQTQLPAGFQIPNGNIMNMQQQQQQHSTAMNGTGLFQQQQQQDQQSVLMLPSQPTVGVQRFSSLPASNQMKTLQMSNQQAINETDEFRDHSAATAWGDATNNPVFESEDVDDDEVGLNPDRTSINSFHVLEKFARRPSWRAMSINSQAAKQMVQDMNQLRSTQAVMEALDQDDTDDDDFDDKIKDIAFSVSAGSGRRSSFMRFSMTSMNSMTVSEAATASRRHSAMSLASASMHDPTNNIMPRSTSSKKDGDCDDYDNTYRSSIRRSSVAWIQEMQQHLQEFDQLYGTDYAEQSQQQLSLGGGGGERTSVMDRSSVQNAANDLLKTMEGVDF